MSDDFLDIQSEDGISFSISMNRNGASGEWIMKRVSGCWELTRVDDSASRQVTIKPNRHWTEALERALVMIEAELLPKAT